MAVQKLICTHNHSGKLILKDTIEKMDFGLFSKSLNQYDSITDILEDIYYNSDTPYIILHIRQIDNNHKIDVSGELLIDKDSDGIYSWFVGEFQLEKQLFELVDKELLMKLQHVSALGIAEDSGDAK